MTIDPGPVISEIDDVLKRYEEIERKFKVEYITNHNEKLDFIKAPEMEEAEIIALLKATIDRLAPPGYGQEALKSIPKIQGWESKKIRTLAGVLKALRSEYEAGRLLTYKERIQADLFSDFLEMAEYLLEDEGFKDPAAVLAGGVLEKHLRNLCDNHGIPLSAQPKLDTMNADLVKASVYGKNEQKQITAWAGIRNSAAHAEWDKYDGVQVRQMVQGIRHFISSYPT